MTFFRFTLKVIVGATHSRDKWLQFATMRRSYSQNFHLPGRCKAFMSVTDENDAVLA
jgi:hypothetical protein